MVGYSVAAGSVVICDSQPGTVTSVLVWISGGSTVKLSQVSLEPGLKARRTFVTM